MDNTATTSATCLSDFGWTFNSLGQSPCEVSAHLWDSCASGTGCAGPDGCIIPPSLAPGTNYTSPLSNFQDCQCTTVWYSTMAACAVCQGRGLSIDPWEEFSASCYPLYMQQFPSSIPNYTAVPGWAYLPIAEDEFDVSTAERLAVIHPAENTIPIIVPGPLSSTPAPTSPPFTSSRSMTSTSGISSPTQTQRVQSVSKTNLAAMVAGSVIGGGVFFVGLVLATFYLLRRRRRALYAEKLDRRRNVILPPDLEAVPSPSAAPATGRKSTATRIMHSVDHTVLTDVASFHAPPIPVNSASSPTSPVKDLLHSVAGILRPTPAEGPPQPSERELDSGWREHPVATLPPAYTED